MTISIGGTWLEFAVVDETGDILDIREDKRKFESPLLVTEKDARGTPTQFFLDDKLTELEPSDRPSKYVQEKQREFLQGCGIEPSDILAQGMNLCGDVWEDNGTTSFVGGNTPEKYFAKDTKGRLGISINLQTPWQFKAGNDGNNAAKAQGIYYLVKEGLPISKSGYIILGTGYGAGVPDAPYRTEVHGPVSFIHPLLAQECGCTPQRTILCAENFAAGRGIGNTAKRVVGLYKGGEITELAKYESSAGRIEDLEKAIGSSLLLNMLPENIDSKLVMGYANHGDPFAKWVAHLAALVTKDTIVNLAHLFNLERVGIGESVAENNHWHVENINRLVQEYVQGSTLQPNGLKVELTPIRDAAIYGAISIVLPEKYYEQWADKMARQQH